MQPNKTDQARRALQSHAGPLNMRERRALLLCDGRRDLEELTTLLGPGTRALVMHLHETGYLATDSAQPPPQAPAHVAASTPTLTPVHAPTPSTQAAATRRSLVAAKLYLIGMLELQRDESAAAQRKLLQASQDADAVMAHLLAGVHCLQRIASISLAQRVRERLGEVLPEAYLPLLERLDLAASESAAA